MTDSRSRYDCNTCPCVHQHEAVRGNGQHIVALAKKITFGRYRHRLKVGFLVNLDSDTTPPRQFRLSQKSFRQSIGRKVNVEDNTNISTEFSLWSVRAHWAECSNA